MWVYPLPRCVGSLVLRIPLYAHVNLPAMASNRKAKGEKAGRKSMFHTGFQYDYDTLFFSAIRNDVVDGPKGVFTLERFPWRYISSSDHRLRFELPWKEKCSNCFKVQCSCDLTSGEITSIFVFIL